jgi:hypothetical protein
VSGCPGREEKEVWFLGFVWFRVFYGFFYFLQNYPPPLSVLRGPIFISKNIARFPNLVPQLLSFCKFDFSYFFYFLITSNINVDSMRKINNFKNDA